MFSKWVQTLALSLDSLQLSNRLGLQGGQWVCVLLQS